MSADANPSQSVPRLVKLFVDLRGSNCGPEFQSVDMDLEPDPSWNELAASAGIEPPMLAPGDHPMDVMLDAQLYWPVGTDHLAHESR